MSAQYWYYDGKKWGWSESPPATPKQKNYIRSLGGTPSDGITSKETSSIIEALKAKGGK